MALARELDDRWTLAAAVDHLGRLAEFEGDASRTRALLEEARSLNPGVGAEETLASTLYRLGSVAEMEGHLEAWELYEQSMAVTSTLPAADATCALRESGQVARLRGDYPQARARLEECLALRQRLGHVALMPRALFQLADLVLGQGDFATANSLAEQSLALARAGQEHGFIVGALRVLGHVTYQQGELQQARKLLEEAISLAPERARPHVSIDLAEVLAGLGERGQAQALLAESLAAFRRSQNHLGLSHLLRRQGRVELRFGEWQQPATSDASNLRSLRPSCCRSGARLAARLLGAAEAMRGAMGTPLPPVYWSDHERLVARLYRVLGEQELAAERTDGRAMSPEQAMVVALASL